jgi:hypothetical protein
MNALAQPTVGLLAVSSVARAERGHVHGNGTGGSMERIARPGHPEWQVIHLRRRTPTARLLVTIRTMSIVSAGGRSR